MLQNILLAASFEPQSLWLELQPQLLLFGKVLLLFGLGWLIIDLLLGVFSRFINKKRANAAIHAFVLSVARIAARVLLLITALDLMGIPVGSLLTAFGAVSLALGLAMQDSLANLAQGVVILFANPFKLGDYVEIDGLGGTVEYIDLMHVALHTPDQKRIYISNTQTAKAKIINHTALARRRLEQTYTVANTEDDEQVKTTIRSVIEAHPLALGDPAPVIRLNSFNASNLTFVCQVWVETSRFWDLHYDLLEQVRAALVAANIQSK